jgi:hypothetical protein
MKVVVINLHLFEIEFAPSGRNFERAKYLHIWLPSHLPEHPSAGISTFFIRKVAEAS